MIERTSRAPAASTRSIIELSSGAKAGSSPAPSTSAATSSACCVGWPARPAQQAQHRLRGALATAQRMRPSGAMRRANWLNSSIRIEKPMAAYR